jgi:Putative metallopeptidase
MKLPFALSLLALALLTMSAAVSAAPADPDAAFVNGKVRLADVNGDNGYRAPLSADYNIIRQKMMRRHVLEEYVKFLSPLRLPKTLWIYAEECEGGPGASPHYSPDQRAMVMCYQFMKFVEDRAQGIVQLEFKNPRTFPMRVSRDGFISGIFAGVVLHETGHALFDILDAPIFGRQEDAADEMSTFVALQFQRPLAELVVASYADLSETLNNPPTDAPNTSDPNYPQDKTTQCFLDPFCAFSDEHGAWGQRFFNTLCLTYGSDPTRYANLVAAGWLSRDRDCVGEYERVKQAFATTVLPFVDLDLMKKVQARQWFKPNELK